MTRLQEIKELQALAEKLQLENSDLIGRYSFAELEAIYNGIGPEAFPEWLRGFISALHPSLAVVALIHDLEWHASDFSRESFTESNRRFKSNGSRAAKGLFGWYDPRRYIVMNQARRFANICQAFGWKAWCDAGIARKRSETIRAVLARPEGEGERPENLC